MNRPGFPGGSITWEDGVDESCGVQQPVRLEPLRMLCSPPRLCCYRDSKYTIEEVGAKLTPSSKRWTSDTAHRYCTPQSRHFRTTTQYGCGRKMWR